jgi:hypothetical protein
MMKRNSRGALFAVCGLIIFGACGDGDDACTDFGCETGVTLAFEPAITAPGDYIFTVNGPTVNESCSVTLPLVSSEQCGAGVSLRRDLVGVSELWSSASSELTLVIQRDGAVVANIDVRPKFVNTDPGVDACGPCLAATETISLP